MDIQVNSSPVRRGKRSELIAGRTYPNMVCFLRVSRGMTLQELADVVNKGPFKETSLYAMNRFEKHGKGISRAKIYFLANFFNLPAQVMETPYTHPYQKNLP
jgi:transcriptional regulator with XRE-family HTH domain